MTINLLTCTSKGTLGLLYPIWPSFRQGKNLISDCNVITKCRGVLPQTIYAHYAPKYERYAVPGLM